MAKVWCVLEASDGAAELRVLCLGQLGGSRQPRWEGGGTWQILQTPATAGDSSYVSRTRQQFTNRTTNHQRAHSDPFHGHDGRQRPRPRRRASSDANAKPSPPLVHPGGPNPRALPQPYKGALLRGNQGYALPKSPSPQVPIADLYFFHQPSLPALGAVPSPSPSPAATPSAP